MNLQPVYTTLLKLKGVSPTALTVVGVVGVVAAAVMSSRATLKLSGVMDEINTDLETVETEKNHVDYHGVPVHTNKQIAMKKSRVFAHGAKDVAVLYGPAVVVGIVSIAAIAGGHGIMLKRNAALAGALTLTEKAFDSYRKAVAKEIGDVREKEIRYSVEHEQVSDTKAGTITDVVTSDPTKRSPYSRMFDENNRNWDRNADYNQMFLTAQQEYANQRFQRQGWLLLNDVLHALGFEKTTTGAVVGWAKGHGDDFIDFGIYDLEQAAAHMDFARGEDLSYLLDFNVAGVVYTMIGEN